MCISNCLWLYKNKNIIDIHNRKQNPNVTTYKFIICKLKRNKMVYATWVVVITLGYRGGKVGSLVVLSFPSYLRGHQATRSSKPDAISLGYLHLSLLGVFSQAKQVAYSRWKKKNVLWQNFTLQFWLKSEHLNLESLI